MKNQLNYLVFMLLTSMTLLMSCKDDEPHINLTILDSPTHDIKVEENSDDLQFTIEVFSDNSNDLEGTYPNVDLVSFFIDQNANGIIDEDVDWGIGVLEYNKICTFYIKDSTALSGCGVFESDARLTSDFASSSLDAEEHIIWDISIPKKDLDNSKPLNIVVKTFATGDGYTTFPRENIHSNTGKVSFDKVLSIDW